MPFEMACEGHHVALSFSINPPKYHVSSSNVV
jgi:hypothetical protein